MIFSGSEPSEFFDVHTVSQYQALHFRILFSNRTGSYCVRIRIPDPHGLFHFTYSPHRESPVILCDRTDTYESQQKNSHSAMRVGKGRVLGTPLPDVSRLRRILVFCRLSPVIVRRGSVKLPKTNYPSEF